MNIAYLTQITNIKIRDGNPISYIADLDDDPAFAKVLPSHLVPPVVLDWARCQAMPENALDQFVEARTQLFLERLKQELIGIPFDEFERKSLVEQLGIDAII